MKHKSKYNLWNKIKSKSIKNFLLEAFTFNSFSYVVAGPIELFIAKISPIEHFKVRMVALILNTILGRPYGKWRSFIFRLYRIKSDSSFLKTYVADTTIFLSFQLPLYMANMALGGCTLIEMLKAGLTVLVISGLFGRPYGIYLDSARKLFGVGIEYEKKAKINSNENIAVKSIKISFVKNQLNMVKNNFLKKKKKLNVGVIAATPVDTQFGVGFLEKKGIIAKGISLSHSPQQQTELQALNSRKLTYKVIDAIAKLKEKGANSIMIYCNSLSGAINLGQIRSYVNVPVVTPLDVYSNIANSKNNFGLIAANCQSTANIERVILSRNKNAKVFGVANLALVEEVENNEDPNSILEKHSLSKISSHLKDSGAEILLLGCTHFTYFSEEYKKCSSLPIFEPSEEMVKLLHKVV
jgi:glutamate racemase